MTKSTYRKKTRELLLRLIYQMSITDDYSDNIRDEFLASDAEYIGDMGEDHTCIFDREAGEKPDIPYFNWSLSLVLDNLESIDEQINEASTKWKTSRMSKVDLSILRLAVTEISYMDDISDSISANEAVLLAKKYSTERSSSFINGVLSGVIKAKDVATVG
ncbi:MAG: transcription antitermination factor NusB [Clostridiales Family XIII bacterium]|jgi:N utilization substance protein B|nr:transcription antitermination factor NusB [Clostridiales Family XIII bacterium]